MKIKNKPAYVYDIEVFKNVFHCTVFDTEKEELHKFECSIRKNNIEDMCKFFLYSDVYFVGYNNIHYDNPIINYCIEYFSNSSYTYDRICESIFNLSKIITSEKDNTDRWKKWKYAKNFLTLDLLTMLYSQALRVSLKEMQVTMMYKNVQEFNCDWQAPLSQFEIDDMIEYNINDVMSTTELLKQCTKDIDVRVDIENKFNIDCLSKDGVGTGVELLKYEYLQKTNESWWELKDKRSPMDWIPLKDVILPHISFKHPVLKSLLEEMKTLTVSPGRNGWNKKFLLDIPKNMKSTVIDPLLKDCNTLIKISKTNNTDKDENDQDMIKSYHLKAKADVATYQFKAATAKIKDMIEILKAQHDIAIRTFIYFVNICSKYKVA